MTYQATMFIGDKSLPLLLAISQAGQLSELDDNMPIIPVLSVGFRYLCNFEN